MSMLKLPFSSTKVPSAFVVPFPVILGFDWKYHVIVTPGTGALPVVTSPVTIPLSDASQLIRVVIQPSVGSLEYVPSVLHPRGFTACTQYSCDDPTNAFPCSCAEARSSRADVGECVTLQGTDDCTEYTGMNWSPCRVNENPVSHNERSVHWK